MNLHDHTSTAVPPAVARALVDNHRQFLAFLQRRVRDPQVAEDLLQEAFVRGIHRADTLRDEESAVAWFYRMLRNAVIDHYRRDDAKRRKLERFASELDPAGPDPELAEAICQCVVSLAATLKPDFAEAIRRIDVDGAAVKDFAAEKGLTANNAGVRVFRARAALREQVARSCGSCATHGCLDCTCGPAPQGA